LVDFRGINDKHSNRSGNEDDCTKPPSRTLNFSCGFGDSWVGMGSSTPLAGSGSSLDTSGSSLDTSGSLEVSGLSGCVGGGVVTGRVALRLERTKGDGGGVGSSLVPRLIFTHIGMFGHSPIPYWYS